MMLHAATLALATILAFGAASSPQAAPAPEAPPTARTFDFNDPKGVNGLLILLDSTLEPIVGTGSGITGTVSFDPADPAAAKGSLAMPTRSIEMTSSRMTVMLHGSDWLDAEKNPVIEVRINGVQEVKAAGEGTFELVARAEIAIGATTQAMAIPVKATYLPGRAGERLRGAKGDLLVLRSHFVVKRSAFGIRTDLNTDVVADDIQVTAAIVGIRPE